MAWKNGWMSLLIHLGIRLSIICPCARRLSCNARALLNYDTLLKLADICPGLARSEVDNPLRPSWGASVCLRHKWLNAQKRSAFFFTASMLCYAVSLQIHVYLASATGSRCHHRSKVFSPFGVQRSVVSSSVHWAIVVTAEVARVQSGPAFRPSLH